MLKNRYDIKYMFEQGGMSKIYKAHDTFFEQSVAVKEIYIPEEEKEYEIELRKRIRREYKFLASINHPNIVKAIDFFEEKGTLFLVLEFIPGEALDKMLQDEEKFSLSEKINIAIQLVDAIRTINDTDIVHRDIKPGNIMIEKDTNTPKVLDLGIGKPLVGDLTQLTTDGSVLGTIDYMSPEQLRGESLDYSDTFSLGVTLYQFFTWNNISPFYHHDIMRTAQRIIKEEILLVHENMKKEVVEKYPEISRELSLVIMNMLKKKPEVRVSLEQAKDQLKKIYNRIT